MTDKNPEDKKIDLVADHEIVTALHYIFSAYFDAHPEISGIMVSCLGNGDLAGDFRFRPKELMPAEERKFARDLTKGIMQRLAGRVLRGDDPEFDIGRRYAAGGGAGDGRIHQQHRRRSH